MEDLLEELRDLPAADKGDRGNLGVVAGSADLAGPPSLAGEAAMRTGTDQVKAVTAEPIHTAVAAASRNLMVSRFTGAYLSVEAVSRVTAIGEWSDALVLGPGLADPEPAAIEQIVEDVAVPLVVDAAAIEPALSADFGRAVFTPDSAEESGIQAAYGPAGAFARETDVVVVEKGDTDEIYAGDERWPIERGAPTMTVAGTGDLLAGVIGSLLGQGFDPVDAARLGTWLAGAAGERAAEQRGIGTMATDVIDRIPDVVIDGVRS